MGLHGGQGGIDLLDRDDGHEPALVGDVEGIDAEQVAGAEHHGTHGQTFLLEHHPDAGALGQLVADRADAATGGVTHPPGARGGGEQIRDDRGERGRVGGNVRLEIELAASEQHRHAMVPHGTGENDAVTGLDTIRTESTVGRDHPDSSGVDEEPVSGALGHDFGVAGDDRDPGLGGGLRHVGDDLAQRRDGQASSMTNPAEIHWGTAPDTARSLTVPCTARWPIDPPGNRRGCTT